MRVRKRSKRKLKALLKDLGLEYIKQKKRTLKNLHLFFFCTKAPQNATYHAKKYHTSRVLELTILIHYTHANKS